MSPFLARNSLATAVSPTVDRRARQQGGLHPSELPYGYHPELAAFACPCVDGGKLARHLLPQSPALCRFKVRLPVVVVDHAGLGIFWVKEDPIQSPGALAVFDPVQLDLPGPGRRLRDRLSSLYRSAKLEAFAVHRSAWQLNNAEKSVLGVGASVRGGCLAGSSRIGSSVVERYT